MEQSPNPLDKYLSDLRTIRGLMTRYEEQPLVRHWVFALWGVLTIGGSIVSYRLAQGGGYDAGSILRIVWMPVLVVGGLLETLGWIQQRRDSGVALFTRRMNRLLGAYAGLIVVVLILVFHMAPTGMSAGVVLAIGATPLLAYAQMTYSSLFVEAFSLLVLAIVLEAINVDSVAFTAGAGIAIGVVYVVSGVHSRIAERRREADAPPVDAPPAHASDQPEGPTGHV